MPLRSIASRGWPTLREYLVRIWDNAAEDNIFFLAGAIAFSILLVGVPFALLLLSGLGYLLNQSTAQSTASVWAFIASLLPPDSEAPDSPIHKLLSEVIRVRGTFGLFGLIGFVWLTTRLFGTLRSVLAEVFDIEVERGIIQGKIFDIKITILSTALFVIYSAANAYLRLAATRGILVVQRYGLQPEVLGRLGYWIGSLVASGLILLMFFSIYKFLPNRRIRWQSALVAAVVTSILFEIAKVIFTVYALRLNPHSFYTGTLYALVLIVIWVYYSAVIFVLGGEAGRVSELRRVRRLQREILED